MWVSTSSLGSRSERLAAYSARVSGQGKYIRSIAGLGGGTWLDIIAKTRKGVL